MIFERLIDDYYWKELPGLITQYFKEREITFYHSLKSSDTTELKVTLNVIDNMINFHLSGKKYGKKNKETFMQLQEACENNERIDLKNVLKSVETLNMKRLHSRIYKKFEDHLHQSDVDEFIKFVEIYPDSIEMNRNLHVIWEACGQASILSKSISNERLILYDKDHNIVIRTK